MKVPFPYSNRAVQRYRPALVVAIPDTPGVPDLLWVLMVTSASHRGWPGDVLIADHEAAGLPAASIVRPAKIATIESRDAEPIGRLPPTEQEQLAGTLRSYLARVLEH